MNLQKGRSDGGGPATSPMIKSAKKMAKREKRIGAVRIGYLPQWGIFPSYKVRFTKSPHSSWDRILSPPSSREKIFFSLSTTSSSLLGIIFPFSKIISLRSEGFGSWKIR